MGLEAREILSEDDAKYLRRVLMKRVRRDRWEDKEDQIQECIKHCCEKIGEYRGENDASLRTFLVSVALTKAFEDLRKPTRHKRIRKEKAHKIVEQPWVFGGHDRPSKEELAIMREKRDQL